MDTALLSHSSDQTGATENDGPLALYGQRLAVARVNLSRAIESDRARLCVDLGRLRDRAQGR